MKMPSFTLRATDGEWFALDSFSPDQLLVAVFLANQCPFVDAWEARLLMLAVEYAGRGAAFVAICSSDPENHPEDSSAEMGRRALHHHYPFPYLQDPDGSVAERLGARVTPEVFVIDHDRRLRYHGAIDSEVREERHPAPYLRDALDALIAGRSPDVAESEPVGCPIIR